MKLFQKPMYKMLAILLLASCRGTIEPVTYVTDEFTLKTVKVVSYEIETVTTRQTASGNLNEIDKVKAVPIITRDAVKMGFDENGQTELFIKKMNPDQVLLPSDKIPKNSLPEVIYSHIVGGVGNFYGKDHKLLYTLPIEETPIDTNLLFNDNTNKTNDRPYLKDAKAMGAIITDLRNGTISMRIAYANLDAYSGVAARTNEENNLEDTYSITILDTLRGMAVATAILDLQDKPIFSLYYNYHTNEEGKLVLYATQKHTFETDPNTQEEVDIQVNSVYKNLTLSEN